jgi:hypothetical protein
VENGPTLVDSIMLELFGDMPPLFFIAHLFHGKSHPTQCHYRAQAFATLVYNTLVLQSPAAMLAY